MPLPSMFVTHVNGSTDIRDIDKIRSKSALLAWGRIMPLQSSLI